MVDCYIFDLVWDTHGVDDYLDRIKAINSPKNNYYKKFFINSEQIPLYFEGKKVCIWGCGNYGKKALRKLEGICSEITLYDSDKNKSGTMLDKFFIRHINDLEKHYDDKSIVVVANHNHLCEMIDSLLKKGIENIAIVT